MRDCLLLLLGAALFAGFNLFGSRRGEAPGGGGWLSRDRFPRGFKFMMVLNWLIVAMLLFGSFSCLYQKLS